MYFFDGDIISARFWLIYLLCFSRWKLAPVGNSWLFLMINLRPIGYLSWNFFTENPNGELKALVQANNSWSRNAFEKEIIGVPRTSKKVTSYGYLFGSPDRGNLPNIKNFRNVSTNDMFTSNYNDHYWWCVLTTGSDKLRILGLICEDAVVDRKSVV